ncbi:MAG: PAS domain S-box protein [Deltaproteobacteria bacterium]|nr:PAS domain S-box protein [Deltaproteobacteria bacterium]MBW2152601.1 PAS domain S-box protein [Deltaproteobacteria bacterium]
MLRTLKKLGHSIVPRLMFTMALTLFITLSAWAYLDIKQHREILQAVETATNLSETNGAQAAVENRILLRAAGVFVTTAGIIFILILRLVNRPIQKLILGTQQIAKGEYTAKIETDHEDELGQLAAAINRMGREISRKQAELNRQRDEYQILFELAPCIITVQDRNYKLIQYNREFAEKFAPRPGDYCYNAYKGKHEKCPVCPVENTFEDGKSHRSEETGFYKDGTVAHWLVNTSPIKNDKGEIVAVIEMILDITHRKKLEEELEKSEKKYYAIFNNIPNPVFVLDRDTLTVLDCNQSVASVYGYTKEDIINKSFMELFSDEDTKHHRDKIKEAAVINQAKHIHRNGNILFVDIWVSPSEYPGQKIFLVTTSDITQRIEAEKQLSHASKMATLGQMATGVAHELNQPLTVIKTLSSFLMKTLKGGKTEDVQTLLEVSEKIGSNVDRAAKIINHMREFARKSEIRLEPVQVNEVLEKAIEMFNQQLRVRGIDVIWDIQQDLPSIMADADRLEQVFVNLLLNARDAIEVRAKLTKNHKISKAITLKTRSTGRTVTIEVSDTGTGIDEAVGGKIFEPFFTTKEVGQGTGLGLSISYGIVKDFGGDIQTVKKQDPGACFRISFPVQDSPNG